MSARDAEIPHVLFVALYSGDSFCSALERTAQHLQIGHVSPLRVHALVNKAVARMPSWITQHELSRMPADAQAQHRNLSHGKPKSASIYLWKAFLYRAIPVAKLIVLDLDIVLVSSATMHGLWAHFERFESRQVLGIVPEQGPTYARLKLKGLNGGVQLHHLERMRTTAGFRLTSSETGNRDSTLVTSADTMDGSSFDAILRRCASGGCPGWDRVEPSLGDQTLYSYVCHHESDLCRSLPCGWNRQMSTRFYTAQDFTSKWHVCTSGCSLLHFNQPLLEALVPSLQKGNRQPSCNECRVALSELKNRTRASGSHNPKFKWGTSKQYMAQHIESCCCSREHEGELN